MIVSSWSCPTCLSLIFVFGSLAWGEDVPGISRTRPAEGPYVEVSEGFMVPYAEKIPGTDVSFEMVPIPGGRFTMGSPETEAGRNADEGPQFRVTVDPFWMGKYEVTWGEYKEFMKMYRIFKQLETQRMRQVTADNEVDAITAPTELYDPSMTFLYGDDDRLPAVTMTQYAAKQYTKWLSKLTGEQYRLPTEAEWEYAARAGTTTAYHFGNDPALLDQYGWYYDNSDESPHLVGQKKPNPWGLYDIHGNVWEWVIDQYLEEGYARFAGKETGWQEAVTWPSKAFPRVVRGGSWDDDPEQLRSAAKMGSHDYDWKSEDPNLPLSPWWYTSDPARAVGMRIVRSLRPLPPQQIERFWEIDVDEIRQDVASRLEEGRGVRGLVDPQLPAAIQSLERQ